MTGGRAPKRKGYVFETELVDIAKASRLPAQRAWGSNGQSMRCHASVDVLVADQRVQCKRVKRLPLWLGMSEHVDAVAVREDRGETFVIVRLSDWLDLLAGCGKQE